MRYSCVFVAACMSAGASLVSAIPLAPPSIPTLAVSSSTVSHHRKGLSAHGILPAENELEVRAEEPILEEPLATTSGSGRFSPLTTPESPSSPSASSIQDSPTHATSSQDGEPPSEEPKQLSRNGRKKKRQKNNKKAAQALGADLRSTVSGESERFPPSGVPKASFVAGRRRDRPPRPGTDVQTSYNEEDLESLTFEELITVFEKELARAMVTKQGRKKAVRRLDGLKGFPGAQHDFTGPAKKGDSKY